MADGMKRGALKLGFGLAAKGRVGERRALSCGSPDAGAFRCRLLQSQVILMLVTNLSLQAGSTEAVHGMVASVHPAATKAGVRVLKQGGNAIDAAVAVALTVGVVDSDNSGVGGGCFIQIRRADGSFVAIDGREKAPAAATPKVFVRDGKADTALTQSGALASGVPGALAVYEFAVERYGRKKLKDLILPAAEIAEEGFRLDADYARNLKRVAEEMARFSSTRAVFFKAGKPLA